MNRANNNPSLSIIFPNWNGNKQDLLLLLNSIKQSNYIKNKLEVVMVDNGSTDDSVEFVSQRFPWVKIIKLPKNFGFAKAVNIGIKQSTNEFLFITNNDVRLDKNCLDYLVQFLDNNPWVGVVGGKIYNQKYKKRILSAALSYNFFTGRFTMSKRLNKLQEVDWVAGCGMLCSKALWKKLRGFDEDFFFTGEELDFCLRAQYLGLKNIYYPKAYLWHKGGSTSGRVELFRFKYYEEYKSKLRLIFKHGNFLQMLSAFSLQFFLFTPYRVLILKEGNLMLFIKALIWNLKNLPINISYQRS